MFARSITRAAREISRHHPSLPPTFLLPFLLPLRARISTTAPIIEPLPQSEPIYTSPPIQDSEIPQDISSQASNTILPSQLIVETTLSTQPSLPTTPLPSTVTHLLPLLATQTPHYATIHVHAKPYLLTAGDLLRLPFRMPNVQPGDILRLTNASTIGSRDYTLRGSPYVDSRLFECRAIVVGLESEPMRMKEKTARRNRRLKTVRSKHRYTELVVRELRVKSLEEIEGEAEDSAVE